jgi:hypothetical protein
MFLEPTTGQSVRYAERIATTGAYLSALADAAEAARRQAWTIPDGLTLEQVAGWAAPRRESVLRMLGYPPPGTPHAANPQFAEIGRDDDGTFFRVAMPLFNEGLSVDGILIRPHVDFAQKVLAVAIHGGKGCADWDSGLLEMANHDKAIGRRLARRGHLVWLPSCPEPDPGFTPDASTLDPHKYLEIKARLVGTTLAALDLYRILRSTEAVLAWSGLSRALAVGLSYGGFRALYATALSDRFVGCVASCFVNDRRSVQEQYAGEGNFLDWVFPNMLRTATDVEIAQLICPRPLGVEVGASDTLFPLAGARSAGAEIAAQYARLGVSDRFLFDVFAGGHEYSMTKAFDFLHRMGL